MSTCGKVTHSFTLRNNSFIIVLTLLQLPFLTFQLFFQVLFLLFHDLNIKFFAISAIFCSHFIFLFFIHWLVLLRLNFRSIYNWLDGTHTFNSIYVFIFLTSGADTSIDLPLIILYFWLVSDRFLSEFEMRLWLRLEK